MHSSCKATRRGAQHSAIEEVSNGNRLFLSFDPLVLVENIPRAQHLPPWTRCLLALLEPDAGKRILLIVRQLETDTPIIVSPGCGVAGSAARDPEDNFAPRRGLLFLVSVARIAPEAM